MGSTIHVGSSLKVTFFAALSSPINLYAWMCVLGRVIWCVLVGGKGTLQLGKDQFLDLLVSLRDEIILVKFKVDVLAGNVESLPHEDTRFLGN